MVQESATFTGIFQAVLLHYSEPGSARKRLYVINIVAFNKDSLDKVRSDVELEELFSRYIGITVP